MPGRPGRSNSKRLQKRPPPGVAADLLELPATEPSPPWPMGNEQSEREMDGPQANFSAFRGKSQYSQPTPPPIDALPERPPHPTYIPDLPQQQYFRPTPQERLPQRPSHPMYYHNPQQPYLPPQQPRGPPRGPPRRPPQRHPHPGYYQEQQDSPQDYEFQPPPLRSNPATRQRPNRHDDFESEDTLTHFPIPHMPLPVNAYTRPPPQKRVQNLGPPPSARRPGPAYLSNDAYVAPIAEESPEASPRFVPPRSGAQTPQSERLTPQQYQGNPKQGTSKQSTPKLGTPKQQRTDTRERYGRDAAYADVGLGLAGAGYEMPKNMQRADPVDSPQPPVVTSQRSTDQKVSPAQAESDASPADAAEQAGTFRFPFQSPTLSVSDSECEEGHEAGERPQMSTSHSQSRSPLLERVTAPVEQMPDTDVEHKLGAIHGMSEKVSPTRRPPRLDLDTVRDAEARGSLTSLPELIKRATKLAANLDRGKTASRLGMLDMFNAGEKDRTDAKSVNASMSDILAAFPAPGVTPTHRSMLGRQSYFDMDGQHEPVRHRRRCCGMPMWVFAIVCIVIILLVAAAVLVPVFLILIPKENHSKQNSASGAALSDCKASMPCSNGGYSLISNDHCGCICTNGFTGAQCGSASDPECTTSDVDGGSTTFKNATLGNSIDRLLMGAESNFSIPLNSTSVLALFSASNLSCTSENSLITFDSKSQKLKRFWIVSDDDDEQPAPEPVHSNSPAPTPRAELVAAAKELKYPRDVGSSAGIVFQASSTTSAEAATGTDGAVPTPPPSGTLAPASQADLDFARIVVLFVLEQTDDLSAAINAQQQLQNHFVASNATSQIDFNYPTLNVTADFGYFRLDFGNGTMLGGDGDGSGSLTG